MRVGVRKRKARLMVLLGPLEVRAPLVLPVVNWPVEARPRCLPCRAFGLVHQKVQLVYCRHGDRFGRRDKLLLVGSSSSLFDQAGWHRL